MTTSVSNRKIIRKYVCEDKMILEDGIKKGEFISLYNLYKDNKISLEIALQSISVSKDEFFEAAKKYQSG